MEHKAFIPKRFFNKCRYIKQQSEWVNSELVEIGAELEFDGAVFNLSRRDVNYLIEQGFNNIIDAKKIYCYAELELNGTVEYQNRNYTIISLKDYIQHDQLRIYYIERLNQ